MKEEIDKGLLNVLEMVMRCYDRWLSCAAHLTIVDDEGQVIVERELVTGDE